jgi:putative FmdB family regulatory protein
MPIYEYHCQACAHEFEHLERSGESPSCPECGGARLERRWSVPAAPAMAKSGGASEGWAGPCGRGGCGRPECA